MATQGMDAPGPSPALQDVKHTFDVPIRMRVRGEAQPIPATLLHIAISGCRISNSVRMERGTALSFEWRLSDGRLLNIAGVVAARYDLRDPARGYEYAVALEAMPEDEARLLSKEAEQLVRSAAARSYDTALIDISQFMNYRVPDDVKVTYRIDNPRTFGIGRACDMTGNALRFWCAETIRPNEVIHIAARLPDVVLNVHKGRDDELVTVPMGARQVPRKLLRQPFQDIQLSGRIMDRCKDSRRRDAYEVSLFDLNPLARQEIARYIHASQLARLKR